MSAHSLKAAFLTTLLALSLLLFPVATVSAQGSKYFPVSVGKKWVLHSQTWNIDFSFEVSQFKEGSYRVKVGNPWAPWDIVVFPTGEKVYLQSMGIGGVDYALGGYSLYYDFSAPANAETELAMGKLRVATKTKTVATAKATYSNCITLELTSPDGSYQAWTFAPNVGFVQYNFAGITFTLDEAASKLGVAAPASDIPAWTAPAAKADRVLSVDVNTAENGDYPTAFGKALQIGMRTSTLHFDWNALETAPNVYNLAYLQIANQYYPYYNVDLSLKIAPIHNIANNLPADLRGLPLDDPQVVGRFNQMLDAVLTSIPNVKLSTLIVGSEIDGYLGADPAQWSRYTNFYKQVVAHVHQVRPGLKVGTEFRFIQGYLGASRPFLTTINQYSDIVAVSYYPATLEGLVLDPTAVSRHFKTLVDAFPQPIHFIQLGYPSSAILQSSEALQAQFVTETFKAWDLYASRVKSVNFEYLHDIGSQAISGYTGYFGDNSAAFQAFLGSLGLRTVAGAGVDKAAFSTFGTESSARGW